MTGPMDITVLTTVVVTVLIILNVTYTLDTVTGGVSPDIPTVTVAKVNLQINLYTCYK